MEGGLLYRMSESTNCHIRLKQPNEGLTSTWIDTLATLEHGEDERLIIIRTLAWEVKRLQHIIQFLNKENADE